MLGFLCLLRVSLNLFFFAKSGVLTGCPLSATLFVLAMNPFLLNFKKNILNKSFGVLYACADDLGGALLRIASLLVLAKIFEVMGFVSGMFLNPKKCVIIPLVPFNSFLFQEYTKWLAVHIPAWADFAVASHGEYLGFEVGPSAGIHQWDKVTRSFNHNLAVVTNSGAPPSVSVFSFNTRLVPKYSYKAQLTFPDPGLPDLEKKWACNIIKSPYNSFPSALLYYGKSVGFYQLTSVRVQAAAAAIRAAWSTVSNWKFWFAFLDSKTYLFPHLFLSSLKNVFFSPDFWDSPPFAVNLFHASQGLVFDVSVNLGPIIAEVRADFFSSAVHLDYKKKVQKHLSSVIKHYFFLIPFFQISILKLLSKKNVI